MQGGACAAVHSPIILQSTMRLQNRLWPWPTRKGMINITERSMMMMMRRRRRVLIRSRTDEGEVKYMSGSGGFPVQVVA